MRGLVFICPEIGRPVVTGIEMDAMTFNNLSRGTAEFDCPHCFQSHLLLGVHAWLSELPRKDDVAVAEKHCRVSTSHRRRPSAGLSPFGISKEFTHGED
jgi:hypothetical protein